ncbi:hypothetical protein AgCh_009566 [Apium graveolens]
MKLKKEGLKQKGNTKDVSSKAVSKQKENVYDEDNSPARSQVDEFEAVVNIDDEDDILWQTDILAEAAK